MLATRHHDHAPLGWTSGMNLFSLMFALLLALAFIVLLMLFYAVMQRERRPMQAPTAPTHAVIRVAIVPWRGA